MDLPIEKKEAAEATGRQGLWLEVFCPDDQCLREEERIKLPVERTAPGAEKGFWLNMFCPEDRCEVEEGSQLP